MDSAPLIYLGIGLGVVVLALIWWWVPKWQVRGLRGKIRDAKARADLEDNLRKTLSQLFGGVAVMLAAAFAYYQSQVAAQQSDAVNRQSREASERTLKASQALLVSQQTSKGFELLGSEKLFTRIGGIYVLEGILNTSPDYHRAIVDTLAAFVHENAHETAPSPFGRDTIARDVQAALTVLGLRKLDPFEPHMEETINHQATYPGGYINLELDHLNLRGAVLDYGVFLFAYFKGSNLRDVTFEHAMLARAMFMDADLTGVWAKYADLRAAQFDRANLTSANLQFSNLENAMFAGANLSGANLDWTMVTQSQLDVACGDESTKLPRGLSIKRCGTPPP
jgi:hypothetical protein